MRRWVCRPYQRTRCHQRSPNGLLSLFCDGRAAALPSAAALATRSIVTVITAGVGATAPAVVAAHGLRRHDGVRRVSAANSSSRGDAARRARRRQTRWPQQRQLRQQSKQRSQYKSKNISTAGRSSGANRLSRSCWLQRGQRRQQSITAIVAAAVRQWEPSGGA